MSANIPSVVVPELFRVTGGVQVFSRRMIEALDSIFGNPVPVISRNDRRSDCPTAFLHHRKFTGLGGLPESARRFGVMGACLMSGAPFFVSTHPHFSPWLCIQKKLRGQSYLCVAHGIDVWNIEGTSVFGGLTAADRVLPVSEFTARRLREQMGEAMPVMEVFPNTFDPARFRPGKAQVPWRQRMALSDEHILMLTVCRVSQGEAAKGYDLILEVLPDLIVEHPNLVWVLGGKGNDLERVRAKAESLGVAAHCRFLGFVPDEVLVDLYRSADLFVLPSRKEGFGIVFLEAAACGLPVIAGNQDGSVDALANGKLGRLVDPTDSNALVAAIRETLSSPRPDPHALHAECVDLFGPDAFRGRLEAILNNHAAIAALR